MRLIRLTELEQRTLKKLYLEGKSCTVRKRSHCLLLSHQGVSMRELSVTFGVQRATIGRWFTSWEKQQQAGLSIVRGRGRKKKLAGLDTQLIKDYVDENSRALDTVLAKRAQDHDVLVSKKTLQRFLKTSTL